MNKYSTLSLSFFKTFHGASIVINKTFHALKHNQFCDQDQVAIQIKIDSVYMPYDSTEPPPSDTTKELVSFCAARGWGIIVGSDVNSHNTALYGIVLIQTLEENIYYIIYWVPI